MEVEVIGIAPKCREQLAESRSVLFFVVPAVAHDFVNLNFVRLVSYKAIERIMPCQDNASVVQVFRLVRSI